MPPLRKLHWPSLAILTTGLLSVGPVGVLAQSSTVVCLSSFNWMDNSKGQSPCVVTAYLGGACYNGHFTVPALISDFVYLGPYEDQPNQLACECNSVFYNVISACGLCQDHSIITWSKWNFNCSNPVSGSFPPGIPGGTVVPQWAFQDVTMSNTFNVTLAESVGDNPKSIVTHVQTIISVAATSTSVAASLTPSPSVSDSNPASSGTKPNTGAIAGGVVGGVIGVVLIAALIFFVMKKRSQIPSFAQFPGTQTSPPSAIYEVSTPFAAQMAQPKLYDPSDPSTFPPSPPPLMRVAGTSHDIPSSPMIPSSSSSRPGAYSGTPEIQG